MWFCAVCRGKRGQSDLRLAGGYRMKSVATSDRTQVSPVVSAPAINHVAWTPNGELDAREWAAAGRRFGTVGRNIQWLLGDWIAYGNEKFGERYARASKITGYDTQTLMNMVYVASRFSISRRRENLTWSHHETLAALGPDQQDRWLDEAAEHRWSVSDLRLMTRLSRRESDADIAREEGREHESPASSSVVTCPRCGEEIALDH
jgi:hypothetical protein